MKNIYISVISLLCISSFVHAQSTNRNMNPNGFLENKGQIVDQNYNPNPKVKYLLCQPSFNVQLRQTGFSYDTYAAEVKPIEDKNNSLPDKFKKPENCIFHYHRVDVELLGCNTAAPLIAENKSEAYYNYFTPGTPKGGVSEVHYFQKVTYKNIYPNIDLEFSAYRNPSKGESSGGAGKSVFEYNFIVHPGGNAHNIVLKYSGANNIALVDNQLKVSVTAGDFTENIPACYFAESKVPICVRYENRSDNSYGFMLEGGDINNSGNDIVIDPTPNLLWGTYYGQTASAPCYGMALDASNNIYVTGWTSGGPAIATAGAYQVTLGGVFDAFIGKLNPSGTAQLWGTYYGGTGRDEAYAIALDASNNIYITGYTQSTSAIATPGSYQTVLAGTQDVFVAKFNSSGTALLWGTYYGGGSGDVATSIVLDASDNVYITGNTASTTGIATAGAYQTSNAGGTNDAFVAKISSTGTALLWGTYYGGALNDEASGITLDANNNVYITGYTTSTTGVATAGSHLTVLSGSEDAFLAKFNPSGSSLVWGTYYGGTNSTEAGGLVLDANGNIYITGGSTSTSGVATAGSFQTASDPTYGTAFVSKFNNAGALQWGSYYGGSAFNRGATCFAIALDASNNIYILGNTESIGGVATVNAYQTALAGTLNNCIAKVNNTGTTLLWGTYYGGSGWDYPYAIAVDASDNVYVAGEADDPTGISTLGVYQTTLANAANGFIAKFSGCSGGPAAPGPISGPTTVCNGSVNTYKVAAIPGATSYTWTLPAGWAGASTADSIIATAGASGGNISVTVTNVCGTSAAQTLAVSVNNVTASITPVNELCNGNCTGTATANPTGSGPFTYVWSNASTASSISALCIGSYSVTITGLGGCTATATATITQPATAVAITIASQTNPNCFGGTGSITANAATGGTSPYAYNWTPSGGTNLTANNLAVGTYTITATDNHGCTATASVTITQPASALGVIIASQTDVSCFGGTGSATANTATGGTAPYTYNWSPSGGTNLTSNNLSAGTYTITATDNHGCTATASVTITQPASALGISMSSQTNVSCFGGTGSATANAATGGTSPYMYNWSPSGGTNLTANNFTAGTYTITATDNHGCTATASVAITQPASAVSITITSQTNISCFGGTGSATANVAIGGTSPYTYNWSPSGGTNLTANNLTAGTYTITATDNHGCTATASVTITQPASALGISMSSQTNVSCFGGTGSATANTATGGTAPYTYNWSPSGGTNLTANNLNAGTYTITATDNNGCTATASVTITQPASALGITMSSQINVSCFGGTGSATANAATGGTLPYTYNWSPSGGTNLTANNLTAGTYTITATDNNGCTATASAAITQPPALNNSATATNPSICVGSCTNINSTVSGGTPGYIYTWNNGATTTSVNVCPVNTTTYTSTVTDANGCSTSASVTVTVNALPVLTLSAAQDSACTSNSTDMLTGTPAGGTYSGPNVIGNNFNPNAAGVGNYVVYYSYTDVNGCTNSDSITIVVDICTGIEEQGKKDSTCTVYPNPVTDIANITFSKAGWHQIELVDITGRQLARFNCEDVQYRFATDFLPSGVYFIKITGQDTITTLKLIKL